MNEEIEYAEMLEIPVSTVNVVRKKRIKKKPQEQRQTVEEADLKRSVIEQVNAETAQLNVDGELFAESVNSEGSLHIDGVPERIDMIRLYSEEDKRFFENAFKTNEDNELTFYQEEEKDVGRYARGKFPVYICKNITAGMR